MNAKTIRENMTSGKWITETIESEGEIHITHFSGTVSLATCYAEPLDNETIANAAAIISAVNGTFGKGLNPEMYETLFNKVIEVIERAAKLNGHMIQNDFDDLTDLLSKAKL